MLRQEVDKTSEDPIFVVKVNPAWVAMYDEASANVVLDFIGEFDMAEDQQRDSEDLRRFVYHFGVAPDIRRCRTATLEKFPSAFAFSPDAIAAGAGADGVRVVPLGFCAVIHKTGVRQDDAESSTFFYL